MLVYDTYLDIHRYYRTYIILSCMLQYSRDSCDVKAVSVPQPRPRVLRMFPGHGDTRVIVCCHTDLLRGPGLIMMVKHKYE